MAVANLVDAGTTVDQSKDSIIIVDNFRAIRGGRTLDTTGFTDLVIKAGHVIIKETSTETYKPMPIASSAYSTLPSGHTYEGVLISTIPTAKPFAGIMYDGTVNPTAVASFGYAYTSILAAVKTALPHLVFKAD